MPTNVLDWTLRLPPELRMPPPSKSLLLEALIVLFCSVNEPSLAIAAPSPPPP